MDMTATNNQSDNIFTPSLKLCNQESIGIGHDNTACRTPKVGKAVIPFLLCFGENQNNVFLVPKNFLLKFMRVKSFYGWAFSDSCA